MKDQSILPHLTRVLAALTVLAATFAGALSSFAQSPWQRLAERPDALGLEDGLIEHVSAQWNLRLVAASQTVAALSPQVDPEFDFTPSEFLETRRGNGLYHLGDLNLRLRIGESREWQSFSSATERAPVEVIEAGGSVIAAANLAATFPEDLPLSIERYWEMSGDNLVLRFEITNISDEPVELGSLGIPLIFNNILHGKSLDEAHVACVFYDPYIGRDAGYLQAVRLHGRSPVLLVVPHNKNTPFEAYSPLLNDPTPRGITFEGFYEWMAHSRAHAETDWTEAEPWNRPTSVRLNPGDSRSYGLEFLQADTVHEIESTLAANGRPVAVGVPGYVLPENVGAKLFLDYIEPVRAIDVEPAGALSVSADGTTENGWKAYHVRGMEWGRARLTVTYEDGLRQSINYKVIKPEEDVVGDMGRLLTTEAWYDDPNDPFNRAPSVMSYDYERMAPILEDQRAWIAGLSDEGGAGAWLAAIMKQAVIPDAGEMEKLQRFVNETMWGGIQYSEGDRMYGVRKSLFFYDPEGMPEGTYSDHINYGAWSAWDRQEAESTVRSYNYPHVAAAHWVMYRLARYHEGLVPEETWRDSLERAGHTAIAMVRQAPYYAQFGQMGGTIYLHILDDLRREGLDELGDEVEEIMRNRADVWYRLTYPFGSEMPWDSTGQEEVHGWSRHFGFDERAEVTLNAVLAYMPTVPHWAYNGSARRYWDFWYAGKFSRLERQIHHYGSGLNAIPVLTEYRHAPEDFYLLRVGHAGLIGAIANITPEGFPPAAFHAFPDALRIDGMTGDYGPGFLGYALNTGAYLFEHHEFGWLGFGGNVENTGGEVRIRPTTAARNRVYLAPVGLWLTLDAGQFDEVILDTESGEVRAVLAANTGHTPNAYLRFEQKAEVAGTGTFALADAPDRTRGAYAIPLDSAETTTVLLRQ